MIAVRAANLFLDFSRPTERRAFAGADRGRSINKRRGVAPSHEARIMFYRKRGDGRGHGEETDKKTEP